MVFFGTVRGHPFKLFGCGVFRVFMSLLVALYFIQQIKRLKTGKSRSDHQGSDFDRIKRILIIIKKK